MGWRAEIRELTAQLEEQRSRLEQVRLRARRQGSPEGERLEAQVQARLRDIEERIKDLREESPSAEVGENAALRSACTAPPQVHEVRF